jgi:hypothetical protein
MPMMPISAENLSQVMTCRQPKKSEELLAEFQVMMVKPTNTKMAAASAPDSGLLKKRLKKLSCLTRSSFLEGVEVAKGLLLSGVSNKHWRKIFKRYKINRVEEIVAVHFTVRGRVTN